MSVEEKEGDTSKVVAVQMRNENNSYLRRIHFPAFQTNQRRSPAVQKELRFSGNHMDTCLESAAAAKGVTAAQKPDFHCSVLPSREPRLAFLPKSPDTFLVVLGFDEDALGQAL